MQDFNIRPATIEDMPSIHQLIHQLAIFEKAEEEFVLPIQQLKDDFAANKYKAFVAEFSNGEIKGMALIYPIYSTWKGECWYLEDIIVSESHRGLGAGKALFEEVIKFAKTTKAGRLRWQVLDWNTPAIKFYEKYNAEFEKEWLTYKFTYEQLQAF